MRIRFRFSNEMIRTTPFRKACRAQQIALVGALFVVAGISGCANAGVSNVVPPPLQPQIAASISVCNRTPDSCADAQTFSLAQIRDLSIHVDWKNVPQGTRSQKLEMLDPGGGSYQVMNTSFVEEDGNGEAQTDSLIPISGSMITQRGITGTWVIRVSLDEQVIATQNITFEQ
jgi:hypothetical protein